MKTLGLIGGTSWVSTIEYYRLINEGINAKLGGMNYSQCLIYSFSYGDIKKLTDADDWDSIFKLVSTAAKTLKHGGAEAIILCANTMHLIAERIENEVSLPVIHIATMTGAAIEDRCLKKVGLLGTKFTMERGFFASKLQDRRIETIIPPGPDREFIHDTIFGELGHNIIKPATKQRYLSIINDLITAGAEGIILGCTEIPLLIQQGDVGVPVFDTTAIHAAAAVDFATNDKTL